MTDEVSDCSDETLGTSSTGGELTLWGLLDTGSVRGTNGEALARRTDVSGDISTIVSGLNKGGGKQVQTLDCIQVTLRFLLGSK